MPTAANDEGKESVPYVTCREVNMKGFNKEYSLHTISVIINTVTSGHVSVLYLI